MRRLLLAALLICLVLNVMALWLRSQSAQPAFRQERLDSLTAERVNEVRRDPSTVQSVYAECQDELAADLGDSFADLTEEDRRLIFCMVLANAMAPYGTSDAESLQDLLTSPHLNCGNYPVLMVRLQQFFGAPDHPPHLVGWDGGFMGPHGMVYRPHPEDSHCLFLDPTVALLVRATFDEVASGKPISAKRLISFDNRTDTAAFRRYLAGGFVKGLFRPSDLLYYFDGLDHYTNHVGQPTQWPTPGAIAVRKRKVH